MKSYRVIKPFELYKPGDVITPTPGMADLFMRRKLIEPITETPRRGRPRKAKA